MKSSKGGITKKTKTMDYTNYAYNEAVGRLKVMLADNSYTPPKVGGSAAAYLRNFNEDSGDNFSDNLSVIERPVFSDISKYLSPSQKSRMSSYRPKKTYGMQPMGYGMSVSKENLSSMAALYTGSSVPQPAQPPPPLATDSVQAPVEIFSFIEKQEDYIEQLEKESKYCRNELTNLLGKVKDVINENEQITENARSELANMGSGKSGMAQTAVTTSPSSDSDEHLIYGSGRKTPTTPRKGNLKVQSPRYASAPNIVYEARISELEAELMQANIDLKRVRTENEDLKRKLAHTDPITTVATFGGGNCETHRKQLDCLQQDKLTLEETVRHLQRMLDDAKAQSQGNTTSKRYISDLVQMERSQAELEVRHLRDELDRQHERVRELQHEMARRLAEERASAERRYNTQVDQLGGDLSSQWEQVTKLQLELERQKRYETDLKRDVTNRNSQIEELKNELRANRTNFLADMATSNAEKQSLEQEITSLRLQLDRAARETKTEAARLQAEINSLRQRLDRGDADLLHSKREVLRLNDEIANLEKELAYGELKNEIRPTKKDLDKRISEMQDKHADTVNELEEMITSQKQLMDKLTGECKTLTGKLEDTTYKHNEEKQQLRATNEQLMARLRQIWAKYKSQLPQVHNGTPEQSSEESKDEHKLEKLQPLTTTRQRHMAQQSNPYKAPHNYTTAPTMTTAEETEVLAMVEGSQLPLDQLQLQQSQQQLLLLGQLQQQQQERERAASATAAVLRDSSPTMDSKITMTRILRTTLAWARSSNNNNRSRTGNENARSEIESCNNCGNSERNATGRGNVSGNGNRQSSRKQSNSSNSHCHNSNSPSCNNSLSSTAAASRMPAAPIWPHTTPTTVPTISSSMMRVPTIRMPTPSSPTMANSTTTGMPRPDTITVPPTTDSLDTSMTPRQQLPLPTSRSHSPNRSSPKPSPSIRQQLRRLLSESQRTTTDRHRRWPRRPSRGSRPHQQQESALQQQQQESERYPPRADHNRARAVELWGQELDPQSPAANPLCHNSLPRQPPARSSWSPDLEDPLLLECSISSPSLMRSSNDETCSELADLSETFVVLPDGSDESVSPAQTTIITARRSSAPAIVQQQEEDIANATVIIERHLDAQG
ncbi:serologically defined colon cancer antigen 8 homolog isoform X4 [Drosophila persimilis]|uniref:serologically defined colon cancer antigen 8 homolog isoform X4 n=1 Tax=Drosophila persimilis TaxID=7234 RepID=UPI000F088240|nr:serologically defined colon cancer antigen 8 homolog isoform X4 [Drosophila persimilis]